MIESLTSELVNIFQNITIHTPASFSFAGQIFGIPNPLAESPAGITPSMHPLVSQLQQQLYQHCFIRKFTGSPFGNWPVVAPDDGFLQQLSAANSSCERWENGWQIYRVEATGQVLAQKYGLQRAVWPGEFITHDGPGFAPRVGTTISIHVAKESRVLQPGFYFAFGETLAEQQEEYSLIRFYWNIEAAGIRHLMLPLTRELNRFQIPFRFKCLNHRAQYVRLDAAVLYVTKRFFRIVTELLLDIHHTIRHDLKPETPLFTKQLAEGLALAEDPGPSESFGMNRCRILAEGLWHAHLQGSDAPQARLEEVKKQFEMYGLDFEHPYLNAGSVNQYEFSNRTSEES